MEWISVKDRLPEEYRMKFLNGTESDDVLVVTKSLKAKTMHMLVDHTEDGKWAPERIEKLGGFRITHWMPLPALPTSEE